MAVKVRDLQDIKEWDAPRIVRVDLDLRNTNPVLHIARQHGKERVGKGVGGHQYSITDCNRAMRWPHVEKHAPTSLDKLCKRCGDLDEFVDAWEKHHANHVKWMDEQAAERERKDSESKIKSEKMARIISLWDMLMNQVQREGKVYAARKAVEAGWDVIPPEPEFPDCPECRGKGILVVTNQSLSASGFGACRTCKGDGVI